MAIIDNNTIKTNKDESKELNWINKKTLYISSTTLLFNICTLKIEIPESLNAKTVLQLLKNKNANINHQDEYERSLLHFTIAFGLNHICESLINLGANINIHTNDLQTPLHYAVNSNNIKILNLLLKNKARINAQNKNGQTALHLASITKNKTAIMLLIKHNCNLYIKDYQHKAAIDYSDINTRYLFNESN